MCANLRWSPNLDYGFKIKRNWFINWLTAKFDCKSFAKPSFFILSLKYHDSLFKELRHSSAGEARMFPCDICSAVFNTKGNLNRHRARHDANTVLPFVCETCGKNFKVGFVFKIKLYCLLDAVSGIAVGFENRLIRPPAEKILIFMDMPPVLCYRWWQMKFLDF